MLPSPLFFTNPGDEFFIPTVSHPGEDAGADIRAFVPPNYHKPTFSRFYRDYEKYRTKYGTKLYIDGQEFTSGAESDFHAICDQSQGSVLLGPGESVKVNSGFKVKVPDVSQIFPGFLSVYKIVPRSGLSTNPDIKVIVSNSPGIIDAGYRDWVQVALENRGDNYQVFTHGSRIAQGLCELVLDQSDNKLNHTTDPSEFDPSLSLRGEGGFGSTSVG